MCSIAVAKTKKEVRAMLNKQKHRAPDGDGIFSDKKISIGMGRLKIIDLNDYPLPYQEDGYVVSYNGEIYNYPELREELRLKGHLFTTQSDTEVLLKAYKEWGAECVNRFNGMFAFVIYDGEKFFLARDTAGEKPLYFSREPFRVASEAKALNWECEELPPAHCLATDGKEFLISKWWNFEPNESITDPVMATAQFEKLLDDAIKLRIRSDVPYALYYSGGMDSSLIATFHNFKHIIHYKIGEDKEDFLKDAEKIYYHLDYPVRSFSPYGLWRLAKRASEEVKVVISGEGADELFGGYVRYIQPQFNSQAQKYFPSYKAMFEPAEDVNKKGWEEFNGNLRELLRMGDRMSSAWGIENRCPFLDRRIIEFAFSLHSPLKINGLATKLLIAGLLKIRNPDYRFMEKTGLYCPVNEWIGSKQTYEKDDYLEWQEKIFQKFQ